AAARAVGRRPKLAAAVALGAAVMVLSQVGSWTTDPIASREIAHVVEQARAHGLEPCATGSNTEVLSGYTTAVKRVTKPGLVDHCDLLFGMPETSGPLLSRVACRFRRHSVLVGTVDIIVMTDPDPGRPVPC
ncbi:MAG TPA: hypothetical protein VIK61_01380, partial [Acidimicrobiia bacterium]